MQDFFKKLWAVIYNRVVVNWKTTVGGIISVILGWLFFDGVISADVVGVVILILGTLGLIINDPRTKTPKK
jgi:uncharacterized membrane protein